MVSRFFFFNDTATTEIYTLSLHDALPILTPHMSIGRQLSEAAGFRASRRELAAMLEEVRLGEPERRLKQLDRKSTRLNSSHANISYAVFCLKKKTHHLMWSTHLRRFTRFI